MTYGRRRYSLALSRLTGPLGQSGDNERIVSDFYNPDAPSYFRRMVRSHPAFQPLAAERFTSICHFCVRAFSDPERRRVLREMTPHE